MKATRTCKDCGKTEELVETASESYWVHQGTFSWFCAPGDLVLHDAAGPCEPGYHRGIPGQGCRCGKVKP